MQIFYTYLNFSGDLVKEKLDARPIPFTSLFDYGSRFDKFLVIIGIVLSILSGITQPLNMLLSGKMVNIFLLNGDVKFKMPLTLKTTKFREWTMRIFGGKGI